MERNGKPLGELPIMSIENPTLVHFRHFSSLLTNEYQASSYLRAYKALHLSRMLYKSALFMQNKPNLLNAQMNVKSFHTVNYENKSDWTLGENKPNQSQLPQRDTQYAIRDTKYKPNQTQFQRQKNAQARVSHFFKQFEKKLVTARQSRDYLENREKDKRNKSFISGGIWPE